MAICRSCRSSVASEFVFSQLGTYDGKVVNLCCNCVIDKYTSCDWCGYAVPRDKIQTVQTQSLCENCAKNAIPCHHCEQLFSKGRVTIVGDSPYCAQCYGKLFVHCRECGQTILRTECVTRRGAFYHPACAPPEFDLRVAINPNLDLPEEVRACSIVGKVFFGMEIECVSNTIDGDELHRQFPRWGWCRDGSIEFCDDYPFPVEFLSPILDGDEGLNESLSFTNFIRPFVATNATTGLHIHVNARDIHPVELARVVAAWKLIENDIFEAMPRNRRDSRHCQPLNYEPATLLKVKNRVDLARIIYNNHKIEEEHIDHIARSKYNDVRYRTLNLHSFFHKGTIEFRIHQSTLNTEKIERWAEITTRIVDQGRKQVCTKKATVLDFFRPDTVQYLERRKKLFCR